MSPPGISPSVPSTPLKKSSKLELPLSPELELFQSLGFELKPLSPKRFFHGLLEEELFELLEPVEPFFISSRHCSSDNPKVLHF